MFDSTKDDQAARSGVRTYGSRDGGSAGRPGLGEPRDVIDRYNSPVGLAWDGPPDAIDRYKAHQLLLVQQQSQGK